MPENYDRVAAIRRALEHPRFYDGDIGADIRWLLGDNELLRNHFRHQKDSYDSLAKELDDAHREQAQDRRVARALEQELLGANEMKAKFDQSAAEGWAKYREIKAAIGQVRERFVNYRCQRPRSFNGEMADEIALEREDQLMDLFIRDLDAIVGEAGK